MEWRLLAGVPPEEVRRLLAIARRRTYARGEVVFHDGDPADSLHLVVSGRFAVRVATPVGDVVLLAVVGAGEAVGELALVSGTRRAATVSAIGRGETLAVYCEDFEELRRRRPSVDRVLVALLAGELRRMNERLVEAHYVNAETRVRRRLGELAGVFGGTIPLTQEEIAQMAGTSRATVNRVLREDEARGMVELGRGSVRVRGGR